MEKQDFTTVIELAKPADVVYRAITEGVAKWWGGEDLKGSSMKLNDEFTITHGDVHYSRQKLVELIPGRKVVWLVTESKLNWLEKDKYEWTDTKMIFDITTKKDMTELTFTHEGLAREKESYSRCAQGWDMVIRETLYDLIVPDSGK
jgi:hypothetical protein